MDKKTTHIGIKFDNSDKVYLQRLEPTLASEYPLTESEIIILQLYRKNKSIEALMFEQNKMYNDVLEDKALKVNEIIQLKESLESKEEAIKQCLEMCDNNERHHDYACATDSVRAILTNPNK